MRNKIKIIILSVLLSFLMIGIIYGTIIYVLGVGVDKGELIPLTLGFLLAFLFWYNILEQDIYINFSRNVFNNGPKLVYYTGEDAKILMFEKALEKAKGYMEANFSEKNVFITVIFVDKKGNIEEKVVIEEINPEYFFKNYAFVVEIDEK